MARSIAPNRPAATASAPPDSPPVARHAVPLILLSVFVLIAAAATQAQQRIASLNLCTDLLLLELVPRDRIVSLSYWAADPNMSYLAEKAKGMHLNHSLAEEIVPLAPDLVLAGQFSNLQVVSLLRQVGYRVEVMTVPLTLAGLQQHLEDFGRLVGEPERASALAQNIAGALAAIQERAQAARSAPPLAVVYGPQGVSPGRDTLIDNLLQLTGYRNLAAERGLESYGSLSLEALVMAEPDVLVIDDMVANRHSLAQKALDHPALRSRFTDRQIMTLPANLTACVGPTVVEAAERLVSRHAAVPARP